MTFRAIVLITFLTLAQNFSRNMYKQSLIDYAQYYLWANTRMVDVFKAAGDAAVDQEIISSFPSVRLTMMHLWSVEEVWLERLQGNSPKTFPANTFTGTNEELFGNLLDASTRFLQFIETQPEDFFVKPLEFTLLTANGIFRQLPKDMIHHCFNHQTMHRGQLITMGRQLGISAFPRTDYIIWVREQKIGVG